MNYQNPRPYNDSGGNQLVTFAQMQAQLKIDSTDEQTWFNDAVDAASEAAESLLNASLLTRTIVAKFYTTVPLQPLNSRFQPGKLYLPQGPIVSITSIVDANSNALTNFQLAGEGSADFVCLYQSYTAPLTVTYVAGYGPLITNVPADIRMAIRTHVASLWRHRESISDLKLAAVPHGLEDFYRNKSRAIPLA